MAAAYLLLNRDGVPFGLTTTLEEALVLAHRTDLTGQIYLDAPTEQNFDVIEAAQEEETQLGIAANPGNKHDPILDAPQDALISTRAAMRRHEGPTLDYAAAAAMDIEEAFQRLSPMFPRFRYSKKKKKRTRVLGYTRAVGTLAKKGMAFYILGQNYKTAKSTPQHIIKTLYDRTGYRTANVLGLSLLPTTQSYAEPMVRDIMAGARRTYGVEQRQAVRLNACVRATEQCASSCLVFSGRNLADDYNTVKKYALVEALVTQPEAFLRMLIEAIRLHRDTSFRRDTMPLVRLNVFSDLPWELMAPELFEEFSEVQFYDYTKVPNRAPPPNYDLTFSFSGTKQNVEAMDYEIRDNGRRVAVVFAAVGIRKGPAGVEVPRTPAYYRRKPGASKKTPHYAALPEEFLGLPVIDGDESDMRPYDPAPSIVGLRWKIPANQNVTLEQANVFVVLVDLVDAGGGRKHCIVSKTARFDDVDYAEYAASETDE